MTKVRMWTLCNQKADHSKNLAQTGGLTYWSNVRQLARYNA
jgi:hypothetical protein